jgi:UDP-N-acetylglucosamine:LPS N-acetylglucosamine transferase
VSLKRIVILSARVGAGHDGAAAELGRRMRGRGFEVTFYDFLDLLPGRLGQHLCDVYHRQLQTAPRSWDWLLGAMGSPAMANLAIRVARAARPKLLEALESPLNLVVSTYPLASQAVAHLRGTGELATPLAIYLTDPSVHRLCVTKHPAVHIAPNESAAGHARRLGARDVAIASPVVAPTFRPSTGTSETKRARESFGLPLDERLALVLSGSWGVGQVERITRDVAASGVARPVVVCGRNDDLLRRLERHQFPHVYGWVDDMPALMRACDLVVQNAGGLTTMEALTSGLPVITYRCLPGHGRANALVLNDAGLVPWIRERGALPAALARVTPPTDTAEHQDPAVLLEALANRPVTSAAVTPA